MEEKCELCEKKATVYCNSDEAKLCWLCDARVHSANFLVARHIRVLLCRICNSHTQWKASGPKLIPSSSFCHPCVANGRTRLHRHVVYDDGGYIPDSDEDEDEEENKVVPLYSPSSPESSSASALKRHQDNSFSINSNVVNVQNKLSMESAQNKNGNGYPNRRVPVKNIRNGSGLSPCFRPMDN
ncbi:hypothetical protein Lal_00028738 [Lupinus albus]|nr:hypothetical protein Lal_00028738 [Lupinus albus]